MAGSFLTEKEYKEIKGVQFDAIQATRFAYLSVQASDYLRQQFKLQRKDLDEEIFNGDVYLSIVQHVVGNIIQRVFAVSIPEALTDDSDGAYLPSGYQIRFLLLDDERRMLGLMRQYIIASDEVKI